MRFEAHSTGIPAVFRQSPFLLVQQFPNHPTPNKYDPLAIKKKTTRAENGIQSTGFHCRGHRPRTHMPRTAVSTQEFVSIAVAEYLAGPRTQSARQSPIEEGQTNLSV